ncbi:hypothetical protein E2C01_073254 [Portunus trituberculatus]|uniref:Uncharacterized protein n=1 Tax=Portunus trituberculatus TaxID=210409 RepID=A0A5B7IB78_PORTR|nr:hypothetical protein [Portunus trituberculatus]
MQRGKASTRNILGKLYRTAPLPPVTPHLTLPLITVLETPKKTACAPPRPSTLTSVTATQRTSILHPYNTQDHECSKLLRISNPQPSATATQRIFIFPLYNAQDPEKSNFHALATLNPASLQHNASLYPPSITLKIQRKSNFRDPATLKPASFLQRFRLNTPNFRAPKSL